ncbi:MAG: SMC-Scp complex subunit ScpB [Deltaproteobacteria bacterium]|nr:SMC-Scp complex subunit ScpB [Deltaproteobacteria bacterium]
MAETTENQLKLIIEALLFTSEKPLSARDIHACLSDETSSGIRQTLKELQTEYDNLGRSFVLKEVAEGFQFRTRSEYAPFILQMLKTSPTRLSKAALETLAIIAYKQPILRAEIEKLRGVDAGGIVRTLMEKGLIKIMGRKNLPGRPLIYGTTKKFLEVFELKNIDSLPKLKEIKDFGIDEQGTAMPLKEVLQDESSGQEEGPDESSGEEDGQNESSVEAEGPNESSGEEEGPDESSGEQESPEGPDQSPQQAIPPAADSQEREGSED